jgi:hypothetical protein
MRRTPFGSTINVLPFPYVGPLYRSGHADDMVRAMHHVVARLRPIKARFTFDAGLRLETLNEVLLAAPDMTADVTYVLSDLARTEDELLQGMAKNSRKALNFAKREGVEIREASVDDVAASIAALHAQVYARQGLAAEYSADEMASLATAATEWSEVRASAAFRGDELLAAQFAFLYRGNVYNWVGAATRDRGVMNLLEFATLMWAKSHGADVVDLVGAPTPGVASYKMGLGATPRQFAVFDRDTRRYRAGVAVQRRLAGNAKSAEASRAAEVADAT